MLAESPLAAAIRDLAERLKSRRASPEPAAECPPPVPVDAERPAPPPPSSVWPPSLPSLGARKVIAFTSCSDCESDPPEDEVLKVGAYEVAVPGPRHTFVIYGDTPLCRRHARARAAMTRVDGAPQL